MIDGSTVPVLGKGTVCYGVEGYTARRRDVLHIPAFGVGLFSLKAHTRKSGCSYASESNSITITYPRHVVKVEKHASDFYMEFHSVELKMCAFYDETIYTARLCCQAALARKYASHSSCKSPLCHRPFYYERVMLPYHKPVPFLRHSKCHASVPAEKMASPHNSSPKERCCALDGTSPSGSDTAPSSIADDPPRSAPSSSKTHHSGLACKSTAPNLGNPGAYSPAVDMEGEHTVQIHPCRTNKVAENTMEDDEISSMSDPFVGATLDIEYMGEKRTVHIKERAWPVGKLDRVSADKTQLDAGKYIVELPNGELTVLSGNSIAESMLAQCNEHRDEVCFLEKIVDHKSDATAVPHLDRYFYHRGRRYHKRSTTGWQLRARWKGGMTTWVRLADLKRSYPVIVAKYAEAAGIKDAPAFAWWTSRVLKRHERLEKNVAKQSYKAAGKLELEPSTPLEVANVINGKDGHNPLWMSSNMGMLNVCFALKGLPNCRRRCGRAPLHS
jgi:hypothetical protein